MMNVLNGGVHADNRVDFRDMVASRRREPHRLQIGTEVFHAQRDAAPGASRRRSATRVGSRRTWTRQEALEMLLQGRRRRV
jgi:enolase